ncbi:hypothetical protein ACMFMG_008704 [Clarireedia jacksonii]
MRVTELRVFHHYITHFGPQQPRWGRFGFSEIDQFFMVDVLQLGFSHEAILSGLLGMSACHYLSLAPEDRDMKRAAREYLGQTTRLQACLVSEITENTMQTALLVSVLLFGMLKSRAALVDATEPYRPPLEILHMISGVGALYRRSVSFLPNDNPVVQFIQLRPKAIVADKTSEQVLPATILADLLKLRQSLDTVCSPNARDICSHAIRNYHSVLIALLREEDPDWSTRRLYGMLGECSPGFADLLEVEEPLALAILARFMALMKLCDGPRYHQGAAEYEVSGLASLIPIGWQWSMAVPFWLLQFDRSHFRYAEACQKFQQGAMLSTLVVPEGDIGIADDV